VHGTACEATGRKTTNKKVKADRARKPKPSAKSAAVGPRVQTRAPLPAIGADWVNADWVAKALVDQKPEDRALVLKRWEDGARASRLFGASPLGDERRRDLGRCDDIRA
jgi:hypothetical protein